MIEKLTALTIKNNGIISHGKLYCRYDIGKELMSWWGYVTIKILWVQKRFDFAWDHNLGKALVTSSNYRVGMKVRLDRSMVLKCFGIHDRPINDEKYANVKVYNDDEAAVIIAQLSLQDEYIDIIGIDGNLSYNGISIKLIATKELSDGR